MSLIRELAQIVTGAENEYNRLLNSGIYSSYSREIDSSGMLEISEGDPCMRPFGRIYHADNLMLLADGIRSGQLREKLDMIYCDPPFFTRTKQEVNIELYCNEKAAYIAGCESKKTNHGLCKVKLRQRAYSDMWNRDIKDYLRMIAVRLYFMRDALKSDGSIFIHLDWHAVHAVKLIMDEIFGEENFVNEIIWTYKSGGAAKRHFSRKHDTILFYGKTENYRFNEPEKEKSYNRGLRPYHFKGVEEFQDDVGWYTLVNPRDVWQIDMVGRSSNERLNYATQKPEALLEKIIKSVTEPGDMCADFFCGSGTLAGTAAKLGRNFICADVGELAISNTVKRLLKHGDAFQLWRADEYTDSSPEYPLRPSDMEKGQQLLAADPESFTDYTVEGTLDESACLIPSRVIFRTENGMCERCTGTEVDNAEDLNAALTFDVFGRRTLKSYNTDKRKRCRRKPSV